MKLQMLLMKIMSFLGKDNIQNGINYGDTPQWIVNILVPIIKALDQLLVPVIIVLGVAGTVYGIVLGVQYAKAESSDQREEAKKRLINAVIGIVIILVALILMKLFTQNANAIFGWVDESATTPSTTT